MVRFLLKTISQNDFPETSEDGQKGIKLILTPDFNNFHLKKHTYSNVSDLQRLEYYNITVRAHNQLGQSLTDAFLRVQTKDIPISKEG
jgi:hypothetical protein